MRGFLKTKGIDLIVEGDAKSITRLFKPVDGFEKSDDLLYFMGRQKQPYKGMFTAKTRQFFLTKDATEIVAFHEQMHYFHFEEVGELVYKQLNVLEKETYVWKQILTNREKWTRAELEDALNYINSKRKLFKLDPINIK